MIKPIVHNIDPIVQAQHPITLVGGGHATPDDLHKSLTLAPLCVAADGGAALAIKAGVDLAAVIGDFDSIHPDILAQIPAAHQHHIAEQDSTDFEKALQRIAAPLILGVGFCGARVDHQLAAFNTLIKFSHQPCILLAEEELIFVAPPDITLPCTKGETVSLFPLSTVTGRSTGLHWPIDGLEFKPGYQSGTSNRATGPVHLQMDGPGMLMIVPQRLIQPVVQQLSQVTRARWPVRAE
ncbi:MAG: thiamine diphosphokinase [Sulfitobacter sp.]